MRLMFGRVMGLILGLGLWIPPVQAVEPATAFELDYIVRPWDRWSLLDHRPANRYLWRQHDGTRTFEPTARLAFLSDLLIGTQVPRTGATLGTWHGHAIADTYFGVRAHQNIDVNVNLIAFQMSASLGYRSTAKIVPGIAAHLHGSVGGMQADLVTLDLGQVTLGQGLMFEQLPLEGVMGRLRWDEWWLRMLIGGQLHSSGDDLFAFTAGWQDLQFTWFLWPQSNLLRWPQWLDLAGEVPGLPQTLRVGFEGMLRIDGTGKGRTAAMGRVDWIPELAGTAALHVGYQYRWYERGYGPNGSKLASTFIRPAFIWREDSYLTNGYEGFWPSGLFDQHWHTLMVELDIPLGRPWIVGRIEGEVWGRFMSDPSDRNIELATLNTDGTDVHWWPEPDVRFYHRIGLELRPFKHRRDRFRLWMVNKVANASDDPVRTTATRLVPRRPLIALELELFL